MEENTKAEQPLDDEQLQDVTGGVAGSAVAKIGEQITQHQGQANLLFRKANETTSPEMARSLHESAASHLEAINRLNTRAGGKR